MLYFFATIGAAAGSLSALAGCGWIALFIAVQLATHVVITLGVGHVTRLPMQVCRQHPLSLIWHHVIVLCEG
jgi:hypothetical protein